MTNEDRQHIEALIQHYKRRLRRLEEQRAIHGISTSPEILNEIQNITEEIARLENQIGRIQPTIGVNTVMELRERALKAYFKKDWTQACDMLTQLVAYEPNDKNILSKLSNAQIQVQIQTEYRAIHDLRDENLWQEVLDALNDLHSRHPNYQDSDSLYTWAKQRQRDTYYNNALTAYENNDIDMAINNINILLVHFPHDMDAKTLFLHVLERAVYRITCPSCGTKNDTVNRYCELCGTRLSQEYSVDTPVQKNQTQPNVIITCPACGANNFPGEAFCDECGEGLPKD